jgi:pSer/pThr/pTyr-binding forkhead associated (FHA) protein
MTKLSIEDDQSSKTEFALTRDEYSLGRADGNAVRLTERNISRHHAKLVRNGAGWVIQDLSSYNGCFVNGERVRESAPLRDGDLLQLGDYRLALVDEAADSSDGDKDTWRRSNTLVDQPDRLVMLVGPTPGSEFPLRPGMLIGRGDECDISINHASVSRVHAELRGLGDGRFEIIDKNSANGVRLNGVELERALIDARDNIELGDVVLRFIPAGQIYRPGADEAHRLGSPDTPLEPVSAREPQTARGLSLGTKAMVAAAVLAVLTLIVVWFSRGSATNALPAASSPDQAAKLLERADRLLKAGDVEAAHEQVLEIPAGSNARKSAPFRMIEAEWADHVFELAKEADETERRALLDRIARTPTVDTMRRKRAAQELAALTAESVDVDDLPSAPQEAEPTDSPEQALPERERSDGAAAKNRKPAAKAPNPSGAKPPPRSAATNATLVRDSPF